MNIFPQKTGRVRLIAQRNDKNSTGYNLLIEEEKSSLLGSYFIDDPDSKNRYGYGYSTISDFYKAFDIRFTFSMINLTDEKIREWVLGLDEEEFVIIRIGKKVRGTLVL